MTDPTTDISFRKPPLRFLRRLAGGVMLLALMTAWGGCDLFGSSSDAKASIRVEDAQSPYAPGDTLRYLLVNESQEQPMYVAQCGAWLEKRYGSSWRLVFDPSPCTLEARPPIEPGASREEARVIPDSLSAGSVRVGARIRSSESGDGRTITSGSVEVSPGSAQ